MIPRMARVAGLLLAAAMAVTMVEPAPALAVEPSEVLPDPALEARAREISKGLRCLVCQNQSIDDSNADLARDLRIIVRERLTAGDSDVAVVNYVVSRYGDFVLLKPPLKITTFVLWFGPAAIGLFGLVAMVAFYRRRARGADATRPQPLSEDEKRRVRDLIDGDGP